MGLRRVYIDFIETAAGSVAGVSMLELGNQIVRADVNSKFKTGKEYWTNRGCKHTSIDINGKDGALVYNLEEIFDLGVEFDVVTDIGVSCYLDKPWRCYSNMYNHCKIGGLMVHMLPLVGSKWTAKEYVEVGDAQNFSDACNGSVVVEHVIKGEYGNLLAFAVRI